MKVIIDLRDVKNIEIREYLAKNVKEKRTIELLADDSSVDVRIAVLSNECITKDIVVYLLNDESELVREKALTHKLIGQKELSLMTVDPSKNVRRELAKQSKIARKDLLKLLKDPEEVVREVATKNIKVTEKDLLELSKDPSLYVRYSVLNIAANRELYKVLFNMLDDPDDHLREEVEKVFRIKKKSIK